MTFEEFKKIKITDRICINDECPKSFLKLHNTLDKIGKSLRIECLTRYGVQFEKRTGMYHYSHIDFLKNLNRNGANK